MENQKIEDSHEKSQIITPERAMMIPPKVEEIIRETHGMTTKDMFNKEQRTTTTLPLLNTIGRFWFFVRLGPREDLRI